MAYHININLSTAEKSQEDIRFLNVNSEKWESTRDKFGEALARLDNVLIKVVCGSRLRGSVARELQGIGEQGANLENVTLIEPSVFVLRDYHEKGTLDQIFRLPLEVYDWSDTKALEVDYGTIASEFFRLRKEVLENRAMLRLRSSPDRRHSVRVDDSIRPLAVVSHDTFPIDELECVEKVGLGFSFDELNAKIDSVEPNVLVLVNHVKVLSPTDDAAELCFGTSNEASAQKIGPDELAKLVRRHPSIQAVLLIGCQTWRSFADKLIETGVPIVLGTHWQIKFDTEGSGSAWAESINAFLRTLRESALSVADAFLEMRRVLFRFEYKRTMKPNTPDDLEALLAARKFAATVALHATVYASGTSELTDQGIMKIGHPTISRRLRLVAPDDHTRSTIRYARAVRKKCRGVVFDNTVESRRERFETQDSYRPRTLGYSERVPSLEQDGAQQSGARGKPDQIQERKQTEERFVEQVITAQKGRFGIEAQWGMGKSCLMRNLAYQSASQYLLNPCAGSALPFFVELRTLEKLVRDEEIKEIKVKHCLQAADRFPGETQFDIGEQKCLLLFDGFDEASKIGKQLHEFQVQVGKEQITTVVSTRPEALSRGNKPDPFNSIQEGDANVMRLTPFTEEDIRSYVRTYFENDDDIVQEIFRALSLDNPPTHQLEDYLTTPYLLQLTCFLAEKDTKSLVNIETTTQVMMLALPKILERRFPESEKRYIPAYIWILAAIGFECRLDKSRYWSDWREDEWEKLSDKIAIKIVDQQIDDMKRTFEWTGNPRTANEVLELLIQKSGLLTDDCGYIDVQNPRYADFLPSIYLARKVQGPWEIEWTDARQKNMPERKKALRENLVPGWNLPCIQDDEYSPQRIETILQFISRKSWDEPNWGRPIEYFCGLLENPTPLLQELAGLSPTDQEGDEPHHVG